MSEPTPESGVDAVAWLIGIVGVGIGFGFRWVAVALLVEASLSGAIRAWHKQAGR